MKLTRHNGRFGKNGTSCVHILDWALHLDEGTPHIHERHVLIPASNESSGCLQTSKTGKHIK